MKQSVNQKVKMSLTKFYETVRSGNLVNFFSIERVEFLRQIFEKRESQFFGVVPLAQHQVANILLNEIAEEEHHS